ncbi:sodium-dependent transporter [Desulfoluna sp.]|uniref:sodium-dependent transporter n=1 Tax=Desulfoluna sp. TaxID=2045199 RepID=UPI00262EC9C0|nr:sodium-dependent transporter [Desulfoluna sp.]
MKQRDQWGTRLGFILAAVGSAIGMGNIWRFPYMVYENGGGAFLIPYFVAVFTAGIPLLILEFGVGQKHAGSAPATFRLLKEKWAWIGWWQVLVAFVIACYYVVIIGWSFSYLKFSFNLGWGSDTSAFFFKEYLHLSSGAFDVGGIQWHILGPVALVWLTCWGVLICGVKKGIEAANKVFMPALFFMVILIMARAVTMPGAVDGLNWLFKPDFSKLGDIKVWAAAFGQVFFSLSIGFAIMLTYSSYLSDDSDINNNAFMTAFINCGFSMLAGIMIFSVLGYMAAQKGVPIQDVVSSGVGLAFVTIPQAINFMPGATFIGVLFFLSLLFAGVSSMISICEACIAGILEGFSLSRKAATTIFCLVGFLASVIFTTGSGLYVLDIVDHYINTYAVLLGGFIEVALLSWFFNLESIREHVNRTSDFLVGNWWNFCLKFFTTFVVGYMLVMKCVGDITVPYEGYPSSALGVYGWAVVAALPVIAFLFTKCDSLGRKE